MQYRFPLASGSYEFEKRGKKLETTGRDTLILQKRATYVVAKMSSGCGNAFSIAQATNIIPVNL
jgi:hypothetical protein